MRLPTVAEREALTKQVALCHAEVDKVVPYLASRGISRDTAERFHLGYSEDQRLTIPYLTPVGPLLMKRRCVSCEGKCEGHAKYLYTEGAPVHLYNAQTLRGADRVVIVEGELDAITVEQAGVACVAYPGAQTWAKQPHFRWCFDSLDEVIVVADGDQPRDGQTQGVGEIAARQVAKSLRDALPDVLVTVAVMPVGHDSNSFIKQHGVMDFVEKIGWV